MVFEFLDGLGYDNGKTCLCVVGIKEMFGVKQGRDAACCVLCSKGVVKKLCGSFRIMEEASQNHVRSSLSL